MVHSNEQTNKLINEKSPYLLQHAYNPVDWYPWTEEAFNKAKTENKPIFLSIGYSTCHWCHVMERESFEDLEVAELLNQYYVAIKVDREERPDIDHLYMGFCQALTGSGGWPLTILMTPEKQPFLAGTYFPKHSRYGRAGLLTLLGQHAEIWEENEDILLQNAMEIVDMVSSQQKIPALKLVSQNGKSPSSAFPSWAGKTIEAAYHILEKNFDAKNGGFGQAPKFPSPHNLTFLLRYAKDHPESDAEEMVRNTLDRMGRGGIYDHIGFGFARYSTDSYWLVPHFEKMLYDNAMLSIAHLESYQLLKEPLFAQKAEEIFTYILRDMTSPEGGFYSAEDADSEGVEGKFYVWTPEHIRDILGAKDAALFCEAFNITPQGNFEGKSIPHLLLSDLNKLAEKYHLSIESLKNQLDNSRQKLWEVREKRIHPHKDDKILTSWNGLMIAALAKAGQVLGNETYVKAAERAVHFIQDHLFSERRLFARFREGNAAYLGYLDDYAFYIWALLELYTVTGKANYLQTALTLQTQQETLFKDEDGGGYFLTGSDAEELLIRPKEIYDGATPSGNSISALNLLRLARLTGDAAWEQRAEEQLEAFHSTLSSYPAGYTAFLQALQFALQPSTEILFAGPLNHSNLGSLKETVFNEFLPYSTLLYHDGKLDTLLPWVKDYPFDSNHLWVYLCKNFSCQTPVDTSEALANLIKS